MSLHAISYLTPSHINRNSYVATIKYLWHYPSGASGFSAWFGHKAEINGPK
jgi:hypothetical protein